MISLLRGISLQDRITFHEYSAVYMLFCDMDASAMTIQEEEIEEVIWMDYEDCLEGIKNNTFPHCIFMEEIKMLGRALCRHAKDPAM